ncbi:MAG: aminotransferase, partial [Eubacterium sp.]|nr:aminotransferase [Eubacterium sp.]
MKSYQELSREELLSLQEELAKEYDAWKEKGLALNMARGRPGSDQLDLSNGILTNIGQDDYYLEDGTDLRNYGMLDGIPEAKKLMGDMMDASPSQTIVFGNSSLN